LNRHRIGSTIITVVLIAGLAIYLIPVHHKINTTLKGLQCRIGVADYSEDVTVTIKGDYYQYILKEDTFYGTIKIDQYDLTANGSEVSLKFVDGLASLIYFRSNAVNSGSGSLGAIACTPDFKQLLILIDEPLKANHKSWSAEDGLFLAAPAATRSDALKTAESLSKKSSWLSPTNWR
jgi:hypothetical protein